jgi:transposase
VLGPCSPTLLPDGRSRCERPPQGARQSASGNLALALEAVRRIDALFKIERSINGHSVELRQAFRQELSAPLDYMLKRWPAFTRFLDDGRICLSNNAAERALRGIALGRKSWLFAGSDRGGQRVAAMYNLIVSAKMNDVDPQARLADILARIAEHPAHRIDEFLAAFGTSQSRSATSPRRLAKTKTGCTSFRSACSPKTAAFTSTASAMMA